MRIHFFLILILAFLSRIFILPLEISYYHFTLVRNEIRFSHTLTLHPSVTTFSDWSAAVPAATRLTNSEALAGSSWQDEKHTSPFSVVRRSGGGRRSSDFFVLKFIRKKRRIFG